jgi:hypothetical protein
MKATNKIFKPFQGDFQTKSGTQFLKRLGRGNTEAGEELLIQAVETGSEFAPGIGKITANIRQTGLELNAAKQRIAPIRQSIQENIVKQNKDVDKILLNQLKKLKDKKIFTEASFIEKELLLEAELRKRLTTLNIRKETIDNLMKDKNLIGKVFRGFGFAVGTAGAVTGLGFAASRIGQQ